MLYRYRFITQSEFTPAVSLHFFKLRCLPMECPCQRISSSSLEIEPKVLLSHATDGYGNRVQYGGYDMEHSHFRIVAEGVVECRDEYAIADEHPADFYLYPTELTQWNEEMLAVARELNTASAIMQKIHSMLTYERFATDNSTTAQWTFCNRRGVCQDFAHLMISLCRAAGMHARYAAGLVEGEGETHAWVEVHDGHNWLGYDPTYNKTVGTGYIKLAHGRDANDCPLNRGRFYQWTQEQLTVSASVTRIKE